MKVFIFFISISIIFSCNEQIKLCDQEGISVDGKISKTQGCLIDSFEEGLWKFYDSDQQLIRTGNYKNGLHVGVWNYWHSNNRSSIIWEMYSNPVLKLRTNIPADLRKVEDSTIFVKFSNKDSANLLNVVFTIHDINIKVGELHRSVDSALIGYGFKFESQKQRLETKTDTFYYSYYEIQGTQKDFRFLNLYKQVENKIIEVSCRYNLENNALARNIFFSIISNMYYKEHRILRLFDKINIKSL